MAEEQATYSELVDRLDRIADLMALTLVRGIEQDQQIRILSAAGYTPSKIGAFLGIRPNTVSVASTRARQKKPKSRAKPRRRQSGDDQRLLERLETKLGVSRPTIYRRIAERERTLVLPPDQAAIALALESKVSVRGIASPEDLAAVRGAAAMRAPSIDAQAAPARTPAVQKKTSTRRKPTTRKRKGRKVFVVHGRDTALRNSLFNFLRALGLDPIERSKAVKATKKGSPYIGEVLDRAFKDASAVVVLLTPDDQARLKKKLAKKSDPSWETRLTGQARPNVLFEAGMAFGRHEDSTILVQVGDLRDFSDIGGRHVIRLHDGVEARQQLAERLDSAGCLVDTSGTDWFSAGSFGGHPLLRRPRLAIRSRRQASSDWILDNQSIA